MQIGFVRPESVVRVLYNAPIDWGTANSLSRLAPIPISPQTWKGGEQNPQTPPLNCGLLVATWVNGHLRHRHAHLRRIVFINIRGQKVTRGMSKGGLPAPPPHSAWEVWTGPRLHEASDHEHSQLCLWWNGPKAQRTCPQAFSCTRKHMACPQPQGNTGSLQTLNIILTLAWDL